MPDFLVSHGGTTLGAFRLMFYAYAALGIRERRALSSTSRMRAARSRPPQTPLGPSRGTVYKLAALFSIDAFAGGFVAQSLLALWLFERFDLSLSAASLFFFWSSALSAFSYPVAAWIAKRIGLVNTMVFTHIPSSIFLILAAFSPNLYLALGAAAVALGAVADGRADPHLLRHGGGDAGRTRRRPPASPPCRAALHPRSARRSPGALLTTSFTGLPLVVCGTLKIAYDLALLFSSPPYQAAGGAGR